MSAICCDLGFSFYPFFSLLWCIFFLIHNIFSIYEFEDFRTLFLSLGLRLEQYDSNESVFFKTRFLYYHLFINSTVAKQTYIFNIIF